MSNARKARHQPPEVADVAGGPGASQPPPAAPALHRGWYLPDPGAPGWALPDELIAHLDTILRPQSPSGTVVTVLGVALWAFDQLRTTVTDPQQPLTASTLADLLTALHLTQAHIVQDTQDLARRLAHPAPSGSTGITASAAATLAQHLSDAGQHGELAAALLHEGRLALPSR